MLKGLKIGIISAVCIVAVGSIPLFVNLKKKEDTKYNFNLHDIIDYCVGEENTMKWFKDKCSDQIYHPTNDEKRLWLTDANRETMMEELTYKISSKQLSYDIAYFIANRWKNLYEKDPDAAYIPFIPGYHTDPEFNWEWVKDWSFFVNVSKKMLKNGSLVCSFEVFFHDDAWKREMVWATQNHKDVNGVTSDAELKVTNALFDYRPADHNPVTNYHYHIKTDDLALNTPQVEGQGYMSSRRWMIYGNTWFAEGYANFGGHADDGDDSFKMQSFIFNQLPLHGYDL